MHVTILGCGSSGGVPLVGGSYGKGDWGACDPNEPKNRRSRASIYIEAGGVKLLIDTSPDLRQQLLDNSITDVDAILYTHSHADHLHGIDDIRSLNHHKNAALPVWADAQTMQEIQQRFPYIFTPLKPDSGFYKPSLLPNIFTPGTPFTLHAGQYSLEIMPFWQEHGYVRSVGFRISGLAYTTDVKGFPDAAKPYLQGLDLWIVDCVGTKPHPTHSHLAQTLEWIEDYQPNRAVLTHMNTSLDYYETKAIVPGNVIIGYDGLNLDIAA